MSDNKIYIYIDGGCFGNHQKDKDERKAYCSMLVQFDGKVRKHIRDDSLKAQSSPEAEWMAMLYAFQYISDLKARTEVPLPDICIRFDNEMVLLQLRGLKGCKAANIKPMYDAGLAWIASNPSTELEHFSGDQIKKILGH
jgi:ribonuclease HI